MMEHGINISGHTAKPLIQEVIENSDLILVMEKIHQHLLEALWPSATGKIFLLKSYGRENGEMEEDEIEDPIGRDLEIYRTCYDELEWEIKRIFPLIVRSIRWEN
jgi:protein-tyrosine phosphatase